MIVKFQEYKKININKSNIILFYGKNEGLKDEIKNELTKNRNLISYLEQSEILDQENIFFNEIYSDSLFEKEKTIIIKRTTDKFVKILEKINKDKLHQTLIIIYADQLEKKSKLRLYFEKEKNFVSIAFYPDNEITLLRLASNYFKDKKILISQENINYIINKCNGDRNILFNELTKIEFFSKNKKKIEIQQLTKLINLSENHSISELIDNCLAKNEKRTIAILNENNFNNEECILITRTFLNKAKKILRLSTEFKKNKNLDLTISTAKPPIFWKDKEVIKQQVTKWSPENVKKLIFSINEVELVIKKNINNSLNFLIDFILKQSQSKTNNYF